MSTSQVSASWLDRNRLRVVLVLIALFTVGGIFMLAPRAFHKKGRKPVTMATTPCYPPVNQDSIDNINQMIKLGWYPVILRNDWPDSAMIIIPKEQHDSKWTSIASAETTRFDAPGEERIVFVRAGRHRCELWMKDRSGTWVQDGPTSFPVTTQATVNDNWATWDGRPSNGWIRCKATRVPERLQRN